MRLIGTKYINEGVKLAKPIINDQGLVLINSGIELDSNRIKRLMELGISYLYIEDERTNDIYPNPAISEKLKKAAMQTIEKKFNEIKNAVTIKKPIMMEKAVSTFKNLIGNVLDELQTNKELFSLMSEVFLYDNYIFSHSLNVTIYSLALGIELKLSRKELEVLGLGAILHDVGKMNIPLDILMKPQKLTQEEYEIIKQHAEAGFQMLRKVHTMPLLVAHCAYQHHERLNGSGYPRGITGDTIHLYGKIIAVADVFDAITSNRVYRQAMLPHEALEILYTGIDTLYDAKIVQAFKKSIVLYPTGLGVTLSNGEKGIVCRQNKGLNERPIIRILERNGLKVVPYELDLKVNLAITITGCESIL
ncbi:HD-GYP domain-containing protein [Niallia sp. NCCP-28]|uniref:HD-GYP domain-containing protein n=1 Tax=Niallia sp. NCCP-28 TaxID=2934712 RepID=UPI00207FA44B|nr:HD-GYP domain-containing protein [Niallia sp. NCCP-28]GKU83203.1 phosphohydrolase [Niallia sp. NCCP-28]